MEHKFIKFTLEKKSQNGGILEQVVLINMDQITHIKQKEDGDGCRIFFSGRETTISVKDTYEEILEKLENDIKK